MLLTERKNERVLTGQENLIHRRIPRLSVFHFGAFGVFLVVLLLLFLQFLLQRILSLKLLGFFCFDYSVGAVIFFIVAFLFPFFFFRSVLLWCSGINYFV